METFELGKTRFRAYPLENVLGEYSAVAVDVWILVDFEHESIGSVQVNESEIGQKSFVVLEETFWTMVCFQLCGKCLGDFLFFFFSFPKQTG